MNIVIRTDASSAIGTGHVMRCLTLAVALRARGHRVVFICQQLPGNLILKINEKKFEVIQIIHKDNEIKKCVYIFSQHHSDIIIVDHYGLDKNWESQMRCFCKYLMVIDDLANRIHDCDILLDQNVQLTDRRYQKLVPESCTLLLGTQYALLRQEFCQVRERLMQKKYNQLNHIFVFLSGSDPENITKIILNGIMHSRFSGSVMVVLGKSNNYQAELKNEFSAKKSITFYCDVENIAELMSSADLCIGSAGGNSWERCCLGLPSMIVKIAQNQEIVVEALISQKAAHYLGTSEEISIELVANAINYFADHPENLQALSVRAKKLVDGYGVERVISALEFHTEMRAM